MRVVTTEGNTFYTHKVKKESVWTVPDEIKDAVAALELREAEEKEQGAQEDDEEARRIEVDREVERIKSEVQDLVGKRKAEEPVPVDELVISKKARVEDVEEDEDEEDDESEEEDWQREAAAQLAAEAEEQKRIQEEQKKLEEEERAKQLAEAEAAQSKQLNMPNRVDLSIDEAKALFKVLFLICKPVCVSKLTRCFRPSYARRMSIHCIHGIRHFLSSSMTLDMSFYHRLLREKKRSTSIVAIELASYASPRSRRRGLLQIRRKNLNVYSRRKSRVLGQAGRTGGDSGKRIDASMDGGRTTGNERRSLGIT